MLTIADLNTAVNHEPRVEDLRLAKALGMDRPRDIRKLVERHREALDRFGKVCATVAQTSRQGGRPGRIFWLNKRQCLYLCTKSETPRATEVTIQMVEVFDAHLTRSLARPSPDADVVALNRVLETEMPKGDFALMRIGRRTVMLNTRRYRPCPDDEAVVIHQDGRITVTKVRDCSVPNWFGARCAAEQWRKPRKSEDRGVKAVSGYVQVLGIVIKPQLPATVGGKAQTTPGARPAAARPKAHRRRGSAILPCTVPPSSLAAMAGASSARH